MKTLKKVYMIIEKLVLIFFHAEIKRSKPFTFSNLPTANANSFLLDSIFLRFGCHQLVITFFLVFIRETAFSLTPITKSAES